MVFRNLLNDLTKTNYVHDSDMSQKQILVLCNVYSIHMLYIFFIRVRKTTHSKMYAIMSNSLTKLLYYIDIGIIFQTGVL